MKKLGRTSVEEEICPIVSYWCGGISPLNNEPISSISSLSKSYGMCKFHASGREDMDVRMLLHPSLSHVNGRPFICEVIDAYRIPSKNDLCNIVLQINNLKTEDNDANDEMVEKKKTEDEDKSMETIKGEMTTVLDNNNENNNSNDDDGDDDNNAKKKKEDDDEKEESMNTTEEKTTNNNNKKVHDSNPSSKQEISSSSSSSNDDEFNSLSSPIIHQWDAQSSSRVFGPNSKSGVSISSSSSSLLSLVPSKQFKQLQSDTEDKIKHYSCLIWTNCCSNLSQSWLEKQFFSSIQYPLTIEQSTPLRVLHCCSSGICKKTNFIIKCEIYFSTLV